MEIIIYLALHVFVFGLLYTFLRSDLDHLITRLTTCNENLWDFCRNSVVFVASFVITAAMLLGVVLLMLGDVLVCIFLPYEYFSPGVAAVSGFLSAMAVVGMFLGVIYLTSRNIKQGESQ